MNVSDLVAKLQQLQIEQNNILDQLAGMNEPAERKPNTTKGENLKVGDHVVLLTSGINFQKGDKVLVTKVTTSSVHFTLLHNKHATYKRHRNVQKVQPQQI